MDLALALIEADLGPKVALDIARELVLFLKALFGRKHSRGRLAATPQEPDVRHPRRVHPDRDSKHKLILHL